MFDGSLANRLPSDGMTNGGSEALADQEPQSGFVRIETPDGGADVYGFGTADGLMINHASGRVVWNVKFEVAAAGGDAVLPIGCPTCVTESEQRDRLPDELRDDAVVVGSGADLLRAVERPNRRAYVPIGARRLGTFFGQAGQRPAGRSTHT